MQKSAIVQKSDTRATVEELADMARRLQHAADVAGRQWGYWSLVTASAKAMRNAAKIIDDRR